MLSDVLNGCIFTFTPIKDSLIGVFFCRKYKRTVTLLELITIVELLQTLDAWFILLSKYLAYLSKKTELNEQRTRIIRISASDELYID